MLKVPPSYSQFLLRIIPLIESFQDASNLYLVMEFMPGGDFLGLLIRDTRLSEAVTKWYIAEMILCVEEAHSLRWIHRDIKPDNFLISASGHLKISDFGLAFDGHWSHDQSYYNKQRYSLLKRFAINIEGDEQDKQDKERLPEGKPAQMFPGSKARQDNAFSAESRGDILNSLNKYGIRDLARSVVGTSQYMAPEVIRGNQYDARCDWWSVAIILYEVCNSQSNLCHSRADGTDSAYLDTRRFLRKKVAGSRQN